MDLRMFTPLDWWRLGIIRIWEKSPFDSPDALAVKKYRHICAQHETLHEVLVHVELSFHILRYEAGDWNGDDWTGQVNQTVIMRSDRNPEERSRCRCLQTISKNESCRTSMMAPHQDHHRSKSHHCYRHHVLDFGWLTSNESKTGVFRIPIIFYSIIVMMLASAMVYGYANGD